MKRMYGLFIVLLVLTGSFFSCQKKVKPEQLQPEEPQISAEEEAKIKLIINFDGKWQRGTRAVIVITGKKGRIVAKNGAEIPITVHYLNEKTVKIVEEDYNVQYLINWLPKKIAQQLVQTKALRAYSILEIIDENTLKGKVYGWNVVHDEDVVQDIQPYISAEEWKRIP
ncbi:hypothetical protein [Thermospira aquatica]|uniref:DUF3221 domain-containing protein n=1 Tax=Thermospira aquatica TaxID=2828656 RepID=A0AAX3BC51_9SPIR|nr:hypothetical protein [Thermospira aquatica]URA09861.1 hypothetical protein KDW03_10305 [Thermospira aquatica]